MATRLRPIVTLADLAPNQEADLFLLLSGKESLTTRDGKPYFRVSFRDATRELNFPIWIDSAWGGACREQWQAGEHYKVRAIFRETTYGAQLEILKIRAVNEADRADGFDPAMCKAQSRFDSASMYQALLDLANEQIANVPLRELVVALYEQNAAALLTLPAATKNHHAYVGGYLEHVLSVTSTCVYLADKYIEQYPDLNPPLDKSLVVAGGMLHDIGKLREIRETTTGAEYTAAGRLVGHIVQGRDIVREAAAGRNLEPELMLRLEHIILAHQRLPEWGSPKPPMTPEAMLVHYADDIDAKFQMCYSILKDDAGEGPMTSKKNVLGTQLYRGGE